MNERHATESFVRALERLMPDGEATKHSDRFTAGIPDLTWCWNGFTSWIEVKRLKPGENVVAQLRPGQLTKLRKLERATGRAWVLSFELRKHGSKRQEWTVVYRPADLISENGRIAASWQGFEPLQAALFVMQAHVKE